METFEGIQDIFENQVANMAKTSMSDLTQEEIVAYSANYKNSLTPPGHMEKDKAEAYMAQIVQLFGQPEMDVKVALGGWCCTHDVGAVQSFADKPDIVCGTVSVAAKKVFGDIIPISVQGEPRQFCATMFEKDIDVLLQIFPQLNDILAARCASAGFPASNPKAVISFCKGVTPATVGSNTARIRAKAALLNRNALGSNNSGATFRAEEAAHVAVTEVVPASGHDLYSR
jgi:hypothetical protein